MRNSFLSWLVTILIPFVLIGLAIRVLLTPIFYTVEYNMPYFPADEYGFTKEDRLKWAPYAVKYLVNDADISYLGDLTFDDGKSLFNERELRHMVDVKRLTQAALRLWYLSLALVFALGAWAWFGHFVSAQHDWWDSYRLGLMRGGWLMIALAVTIGLVVAAGILIDPNVFDTFFTAFHGLFFEGNSWLFLFSDTLIRLFPIRFWEDAFLWAAVIALGGGIGIGLGLNSARFR
jgi:integral membrane protein (TIGR01906 family)